MGKALSGLAHTGDTLNQRNIMLLRCVRLRLRLIACHFLRLDIKPKLLERHPLLYSHGYHDRHSAIRGIVLLLLLLRTLLQVTTTNARHRITLLQLLVWVGQRRSCCNTVLLVAQAVKATSALNGVKIDNRPVRVEMLVSAANLPAAASQPSLAERVTYVSPKYMVWNDTNDT
jgi:hypothetical protein